MRDSLLKRYWWDGFLYGLFTGALVVAVVAAMALDRFIERMPEGF